MLLIALRIIKRALLVLGIAVLLFSILIEAIPVYSNGSNEVINAVHIANQQSALVERINKDILTLAYRPDSEHVSAILELQVTLPYWEKVQAGLQTDDVSLHLPQHIPGDVTLFLVQTQPDYTAIDSAARSILQNTDSPIDLNEVSIIQQNERSYFLEMNTISKVWEGHILDTAHMFFQWELGFGVSVFVLLVSYWVVGKLIHILEVKREPVSESES